MASNSETDEARRGSLPRQASGSFWPWVSSSDWRWVVHKFGGTSVGNADCYRKVKVVLDHTLAQEDAPGKVRQGAVVSAMSKITDGLLEVIDLATRHNQAYERALQAIIERHLATMEDLLSSDKLPPGCAPPVENPSVLLANLKKVLEADSHNIYELLRAIYLTQHCPNRYMELIVGHGEIWSAQMLCAYLRASGVQAGWLDARQVLVVEESEANTVAPAVDWSRSKAKIDEWFQHRGKEYETTVITGFVASTKDGIPTTLKRNGSDYSGSIFGNLLDAQTITIWTDVDGVYNADPRRVAGAALIEEMTYTEAVEFAFYGAKIIHPKTMAPAVRRNIPIFIRNTFNHTCPGTKIHNGTTRRATLDPELRPTNVVRGVCVMDRISLITVAMRADQVKDDYTPLRVRNTLLNALVHVNVPLVAVAQAAPEHSIALCVPVDASETTLVAVQKHFASQPFQPAISSEGGYSIVTAVGEDINKVAGVAAHFFSSLARFNVNVLGIAQNGERIISVLVKEEAAKYALQTLHTEFFVPQQRVTVGVVGPKSLAGPMVDALNARAATVQKRTGVELLFRGAMHTDSNTMTLTDYAGENRVTGTSDLKKFLAAVSVGVKNSIVIDCSKDTSVAKEYPEWMSKGVHVISANPSALAGSPQLYTEIVSAAQATSAHLRPQLLIPGASTVLRHLSMAYEAGETVTSVHVVLPSIAGAMATAMAAGKGPERVAEIVQAASHGRDIREHFQLTDLKEALSIIARISGPSMITAKDVHVACDRILASLLAVAENSVQSVSDATWQQALSALGLVDAKTGGSVALVGMVDRSGARIEFKSCGPGEDPLCGGVGAVVDVEGQAAPAVCMQPVGDVITMLDDVTAVTAAVVADVVDIAKELTAKIPTRR